MSSVALLSSAGPVYRMAGMFSQFPQHGFPLVALEWGLLCQ